MSLSQEAFSRAPVGVIVSVDFQGCGVREMLAMDRFALSLGIFNAGEFD
ncbi:hypothetical protein HN588_15005 [Candidatus Bathyarchaeota archaeon]|nr:hypothetical protein [Candidatus Bathyarchaeota archaeon]